MGHPSPSISISLGLAGAMLLSGPSATSQGAESLRAGAYSSVGADDLSVILSLGGDFGYAGIGLEAKGGERGIEGGLSLRSRDGKGPRLIAGPGSASGLARLLADPTSPTALSEGAIVELDRSLESRTSALELGAGPCSLFALSEGKGIARDLDASAAGIAWRISGPTGGLALVAAASRQGSTAESSGWQPDPAGAPAANLVDPARPFYNAALVADRRSGSNATLFALAASYGRLAVPSLALRLESREILGLCDLRFAASSASPGFRELAGPREERLLDARAEARLAMRRASSVTASIESQAKGGSLLYAPRWGRKGALRLVLPVDGEGGSLDAGIDAERAPEGPGGGSLSLALTRKSGAEGATRRESGFAASMTLKGSLRWDSAFAGLDLDLKTELDGDRGLPVLGLDLSLGPFAGGEPGSPALATGGVSLEFPFGAGATLDLELSLPGKGISLAPAAGSAPIEPPLLRVRYRASFSASRPSASRRLRSRSSGRPKASSIAPRAAS
jgi:hypothetical protein